MTSEIREAEKPLSLWGFVAAKVFLGLSEYDVFAQTWAVLSETQLVGGVLRVLSGVINALTGFFAHEPDDFALVALFGHKV